MSPKPWENAEGYADPTAYNAIKKVSAEGNEALDAKVMPINGITAKDAGTMLALLKVARIATGSSPDSFIDLAGYAACAGEIVTERSCPYEKAETQTQE